MPDQTYVTGTVLIPDDTWKLGDASRRCRWMGPGRKACGEPAVYLLNRGYRDKPSWWGYCAEHTYNHVWLGDSMYYPLNLTDWDSEV